MPTGIFYAQGVKTNVLFFTRGETEKRNTKQVWVYDMRANMPQFGKRTELKREHFAEFEAAWHGRPAHEPSKKKSTSQTKGSNTGETPVPRGLGVPAQVPIATLLKKRKDAGEEGRFRCFDRAWIAERGESLDISWLKDESDENSSEMPKPAVLAQEAMVELESALEELRSILAELGEAIDEVEA